MRKTKESREIEVLIKEYEKLRDEIVNRLKFQKDVERSQILLIGIFVAAAGWIWTAQIYSLMLLASAVFFIVGTAFFEQDINIALLAGYLHRALRREIIQLLALEESTTERALMGWEYFRHQEFLRTPIASVLTINRTLLTYLPGFATLLAYFYLKYFSPSIPKEWNEIEILLVFINVALAIFLINVGLKVPRLYRDITERGSQV